MPVYNRQLESGSGMQQTISGSVQHPANLTSGTSLLPSPSSSFTYYLLVSLNFHFLHSSPLQFPFNGGLRCRLAHFEDSYQVLQSHVLVSGIFNSSVVNSSTVTSVVTYAANLVKEDQIIKVRFYTISRFWFNMLSYSLNNHVSLLLQPTGR